MTTIWILVLSIGYTPIEISRTFDTDLACEMAAEIWREQTSVHRAVCLPLPTEQPE